MKIKIYAIVALAALVTVTATAAIAREYFEKEPVVKTQPVKTVKTEEVIYSNQVELDSAYPINPKDRKRAESIFYWRPQNVTNSRFDGRKFGDNRYKTTVPNSAYAPVVYVSDYPCNRCVLNSQGKYELKLNRSN